MQGEACRLGGLRDIPSIRALAIKTNASPPVVSAPSKRVIALPGVDERFGTPAIIWTSTVPNAYAVFETKATTTRRALRSIGWAFNCSLNAALILFCICASGTCFFVDCKLPRP